MTPGLSKDIQCHVQLFLFYAMRHRAQVKLAASPDDHFNLPQGFMWVCMGYHIHFIIRKDKLVIVSGQETSKKYRWASWASPNLIFRRSLSLSVSLLCRKQAQ